MGKLGLRNLLRNNRRTAFTLLSVTFTLLLLTMLMTVLDSFTQGAESSSDNRVVVRNAISLTFDLPEFSGQRLTTLDHVTAITPLSWFVGIYIDQRPENFFAQFGSGICPRTTPRTMPIPVLPATFINGRAATS